jgi:hypothetical protein
MTYSLSIRFASFALAAIVTFSILSGIDALAQQQPASGLQMSQAPAASVVAGTPAQPRG